MDVSLYDRPIDSQFRLVSFAIKCFVKERIALMIYSDNIEVERKN
jgi:hypothetical protein